MTPKNLSLRVLVVDDHPDLLSMIDLMMQRRSYDVKTAKSANEALLLAPEFAPHVVVSDIGMPEMDGFELMLELRAQKQLQPFKSIALTGYDIEIEIERMQRSGYDAHLIKPIEFDQLFEMIESLTSEVDSDQVDSDGVSGQDKGQSGTVEAGQLGLYRAKI